MKIKDISDFKKDILSKFWSKDHIQTVKTDKFIYVGTINHQGKPDGIGRMVSENNCVHEGSFKDGFANGFGRSLEPSGNFWLGNYLKNERHGHGTLTYIDGHSLSGHWEDRGFDKTTLLMTFKDQLKNKMGLLIGNAVENKGKVDAN